MTKQRIRCLKAAAAIGRHPFRQFPNCADLIFIGPPSSLDRNAPQAKAIDAENFRVSIGKLLT